MRQSNAAALAPKIVENDEIPEASNTEAVESSGSEVAEISKEERMLAALTAESPAEIQETFRITRKAAKLSATLPATIRRSLGLEQNGVIMFASAYAREGAPGIAFQAARSAALQSSGRVLYIHVSPRIPKFFSDIESKIPVPLEEFVNTGGGNMLPFVVLEDSGLVCACFRGAVDNLKQDNLKALMNSVRRCFDFTVVGVDGVLAGDAGTAFTDLVDGTVIVTEAERTRAPVARKLKASVEDNGGRVIGAILNRRKYHIPKWIYQILYGGGE